MAENKDAAKSGQQGQQGQSQDQLLQDASTLLLFANTAAKQQEVNGTPSPPVQGSNQSVTPVASNPGSHHHLPVLNSGTSGAHTHKPFDPVRQSLPQDQPQQHQPQAQADQTHPQLAWQNQPPQNPSAHVHYQLPLPLRQESPNLSNIPSSKSAPTMSPNFPPPFSSAPVSHTNSAHSSVSEQSHQQTHAHEQATAVSSSGASAGPTAGHATGHRRVNSSPDANSNQIQYKNSLSPGPASVVLARNPDDETGKRNNNNAMIAAAALAQAADNPLPLLKREEAKRVSLQTEKDNLVNMAPTVGDEVKQDIEQLPQQSQQPQEGPIRPPQQPQEERVQHHDGQSDIKERNDSAAKLLSVRRSVVDTSFVAPPLHTYKVDPDSGVIGCICNIDDDDGFTIQCDICFRWQHCLCMDYSTNDEIPEDEYKCYYCDKEKWGLFDPEACRINTLARLEPDNSDSNSSKQKDEGESTANVNDKTSDKPSGKRKVLNSGKTDDRKKRKVEQTNDAMVGVKSDNNGTAGGNKLSKERRKQLKDDFNNVPSPKVDEIPSFIPNKDNDLLQDGFTAENYQSTYYKLRANDYRNHQLQTYFEQLGSQFYTRYTNLGPEDKELLDIKVLSLKEFRLIPKMYVVLPNYEKHLRNNKQSILEIPKYSVQVKAYSDAQKQKFNGISKLGLFIQHSSKVEKFDRSEKPEKNEKSDKNEKVDNSSNNKDSDENTEDFEEVIPKGTPILEYFGVLDLFSEYRDNKTNQYHIWGTTKPKVLKSTLSMLDEGQKTTDLDVVLDSRFVGNETRFIRKACPGATNCEIEKYYIPELNAFKFLVVTSKDISLSNDSADEELRLPWEWDEIHPIRKMYGDEANEIEGVKFDQLSEKERSLLVGTIDNILYFTECGCSTTSHSPLYLPNCAVFKVKKAITYLLRSTRKISGITNVNLYKPRDELILPKEPKKYISWEERLYERDKFIQTKLFLPTKQEGDNLSKVKSNVEEKLDEVDINPKLPLKQRILKNHANSHSSTEKDSVKVKVDSSAIEAEAEFIPITNELRDKIKSSVEGEVKVKPEIERSISQVDLSIASEDKANLEELKRTLKLEIGDINSNESAAVAKDNKEQVKKDLESSSSSTRPPTEAGAVEPVAKAVSPDTSKQDSIATHKTKTLEFNEPSPGEKPIVKKKLSFADYKKKMK